MNKTLQLNAAFLLFVGNPLHFVVVASKDELSFKPSS